MLLVFAACGEKKDNPDTPAPSQASLTGIWELSSVTTKAAVGSTSVSVYVEFASGGDFSLYQKIGDGRYTHFTGSYTYTNDVLSGKYATGTAWGPYNVSLDATTLKLSTSKEEDTYKKVSSIPSSVTSNVY